MIVIDVDMAQLRAALQKAAQKLKQPRELVSDLAQESVTQLDKTYAAQQDPYGSGWAALRPSTLKMKTGPAILIEAGSLNASLGFKLSGATSAQVGFTDKKARFHQDGTSKMVARPIVPDSGLPPAWEPTMKNLLESYVREALW